MPGPADAGSCPEKDDPAYGLLVAPQRPAVGQALTILAATLDGEQPIAVRIDAGPRVREAGAAVSADMSFRTGVPAATIARLTPTEAGELTVVVGRGGGRARVPAGQGAGGGGARRRRRRPGTRRGRACGRGTRARRRCTRRGCASCFMPSWGPTWRRRRSTRSRATPEAQFIARLARLGRGREASDRAGDAAGLRRRAVLPAGVLRVEARAAVRVSRVLAREPGQGAALRRGDRQHARGRTGRGRSRGSSGRCSTTCGARWRGGCTPATGGWR
jgi:hypothetical protein